MTINWRNHYDAIYSVFGVAAELFIETDPVGLTVVDKTIGVEVTDGAANRNALAEMTIKPACAVRMYELAAKGIELDDLYRKTIEFNGSAWRIENHMLKPAPTGRDEGEVYLILIEDNGG